MVIDSNRTGWIQLPNGTYVETVGGTLTATVIDSGSVTYIIPKNATFVGISNSSGLSGDITTDIAVQFYSNDCPNLASITINKSTSINAANDSLLTIIIAPKAISCNALNCSLTAKAIGEILYAAYLDDRQNVNFKFSGGTNANSTSIDSYLQATYGVTLADVILRLDVTGTITLNA